MLNEEGYLAAAVEGVLDQHYPGALEIILALGPSTDGTDRIADRLSRNDSRISSVRSPSGTTSAALNLAIAHARHDIVARLDGHAVFGPDYLRIAVRLLDQTGADVVGGRMLPTGGTITQQAIGAAMSSKFGVGRAVFRTGGAAGPSDSVYLGVFRRHALSRLGGFDERYLHAQDWELNYRIRAGGGRVWFSPDLYCHYQPRGTVRGLAQQYLQYGRWRRALIRRYPETLNARYLAPPGAAATMIVGLVLALSGRRFGWLAPLLYAGWVGAGTASAAKGLPARAACRLPAAFLTMHWSWALGFLSSPRRLVPTNGPGQSADPARDHPFADTSDCALEDEVSVVDLAGGTR